MERMKRDYGLVCSVIATVFLCIAPLDSLAQTISANPALGSRGVESVLQSASAGGMSLKEAIQASLDSNPRFLSTRYSYSASQDAYRRAYGALLPSLDFMARGGHAIVRNDTTIARYDDKEGNEWTNEQRLVLSQLIHDGGLTSSNVASQQYHSESKLEELLNTAEDVALTATQSFIEVIRHRALVELCKRNIDEHARILELTRIRLENGGGTEVDVTQAEASLEEAKSRLIQARQGLEDAESAFANVYGAAPGALAMPEPPTQAIPGDVDSALSLAMESNRALKAAHKAILQREKEVLSARGRYTPQFLGKIAGGRSNNTGGYPQKYQDLSAYVEMNFNLYRGGIDQAGIRQAENERLKTKQEAEDVRRTVEENVRNAYSFHKATSDLLPVLRDIADENAKLVVSYADQFRMGRRSLVDLVGAQKSLFSSQQVYLNGMAAHNFSYYRILMPLSRLTTTLRVEIPAAASDE
jgi:outer membrane protein, adhesin transport system